MKDKFRIDLAGVGHYHDVDFVIDRPNGAEYYVFVHFLVPVEMRLGGITRIVPPGSCVLFEPLFAHWYRGHNIGLADDWLHISGSDTAIIYTSCGLPLNAVIETSDTEFVHDYIAMLKRETEISDDRSDRSSAIIFEKMCIDICRHIKHREQMNANKNKARHLKTFDDIRSRLRDEFRHNWTIEQMAAYAGISQSRFAILYKSFYGISPINDLIEIRLKYARYLLSNTTLSVKQVAGQCGFDNVYYFSRLFKTRTGCPPGRYYLSLAKHSGSAK